MSYNTNVRIPMSKTASLSDAQNEATETWAEVGNNPINNFSTEGEQKNLKNLFMLMPCMMKVLSRRSWKSIQTIRGKNNAIIYKSF